MRSKEQDPDYRFLQDPDLPCFKVSQDRIDRIKATLELTPFEKKKEIASRYGLSIAEVQTVFNHPWSLELYERMAAKYDPKTVF